MRFTDILYFLRQIFFPPQPTKEDSEDAYRDDADGEPGRWAVFCAWTQKKLRSRESIGTAVSLGLHVLLLILLSWLLLPTVQEWDGLSLVSSPTLETLLQEIQTPENAPDTLLNITPQNAAAPAHKPQDVVAIEPLPVITQPKNISPPSVTHTTETPAPQQTEQKSGDFVPGGGFEGRTPEGRGKAMADGDSSSRGEDAVEKALAWIAAHQMKDGGWSFDIARCCTAPEHLRCTHGGTHGSRLAATALALLPFFGAGYTHETGPYQRQIDNGLQYLINTAARGQRGLDFMRGGDKGMYAHGIAAMALCEAYAMCRNRSSRRGKELQQAAQEALRFIEEAQDQRGGGWRYRPNESPGDLSVTTWQMMALKSGRLGGLQVSQPALYNATLFLDSVEIDGGRQYKYVPTDGRQGTGPDSAQTCSACGHLLRMYLGWTPDDRRYGELRLDEGMELIAQHRAVKEDATCNLYYAYYATLALHHYGGSHWRSWNTEIREFLIQTQSTLGHESGSWYFPDPHYTDHGGRLLNTVLAALVLETPYRIMPLFRKP